MQISKTKAIRILEEIYNIASHATLTGALRDGQKSLLLTYNKIKEVSVKNAWIAENLVETLDLDTHNMSSVGVAAKLLRVMLEDEKTENHNENGYDENGYEFKAE